MKEEAVLKVLDYFLALCELEEVRRQKHQAVRQQSFELAIKWRDEENKLLSSAPTLEQLRELRTQLKQQP